MTAPFDAVMEAVRVVGPSRLWIRFTDGLEGEVDLSDEFFGPPAWTGLADPEVFAAAQLNPATGEIEWPTGAAYSPVYFYDRITSGAEPADLSPATS